MSPLLLGVFDVVKNLKTFGWYKSESTAGQAALLAVVLFVVISVITVAGVTFPTLKQTRINSQFLKSRESFFLAEAGLEDVIYRITNGYNLSSQQTLSLGNGTATVTVENSPFSPGEKIITSSADTLSYIRNVRTVLRAGVGADFSYAVQIGEGGLVMNSNAEVIGTAYSNGNITGYSNSSINGDAYAVGAISSPAPEITGTRNPGAPSQPFPEIDADYWKAQANINNDPYIGNMTISDNQSLGPRKIQGNLNLNGGAFVTVNGPIHITGNLNMNSNSILKLNNSFGSSGTVIIVDGNIAFDSNSEVQPTNSNPKGYIMLYTLSSSSSAVALNSNSETGILFAPNGTVQINSNGVAVSITAYQLTLNSNATITYDIGLPSATFTGPGGGWETLDWREVE